MKRTASAEECSENFDKRRCTFFSPSTLMREWAFEKGTKFIIPDDTEVFAEINDNLLPFGKSILFKHPVVAQVVWENGLLEGLCIVVDINKKIIDGVYFLDHGYVVDKLVTGEIEDQIIDLSTDGIRWEGSVMDNQPFGWGTYYDENGDARYVGFRYLDQNVCYGQFYKGEKGDHAYKRGGCHHNNEMMGYVNRDKNAKETEWLCHEPIDFNVCPSDILQVMKNGTRMQKFIINDNIPYGVRGPKYQCIQNADAFVISYFSSLEELSITLHIQGALRSVNISNCKKLRYIYIGDQSFQNCTACLISSLPCLEQLIIGEGAFINANDLTLSYLPHLKRIDLRNNTFCNSTNSLLFLNKLPELKQLDCGVNTLNNFGAIRIENVNIDDDMQLNCNTSLFFQNQHVIIKSSPSFKRYYESYCRCFFPNYWIVCSL